jgi:hypothetical protein
MLPCREFKSRVAYDLFEDGLSLDLVDVLIQAVLVLILTCTETQVCQNLEVSCGPMTQKLNLSLCLFI